jgi:hypothetical protein
VERTPRSALHEQSFREIHLDASSSEGKKSRYGTSEQRCRGLDLSPQPPDHRVDAAVERLETTVGEGGQQSVATDDPTRPGDEHS